MRVLPICTGSLKRAALEESASIAYGEVKHASETVAGRVDLAHGSSFSFIGRCSPSASVMGLVIAAGPSRWRKHPSSKVPHMPDSIHDEGARLRSVERIALIRATLAVQRWPSLDELSEKEREIELDEMALRQYEWELFMG